MFRYKDRLEKDLSRWQEKGWVGADAAKSIQADLAARSKQFGLAPILAILGAVLMCLAAMTFVAANWQEMSKLLRLSLLFGAMWASYGAALIFMRRNTPFLSHAAILLGVGLFGANIMLIAQMYHMEGNPPDAVMLWAGGALLAGVMLRSRPALGLTVMLISLWSWWEVVETNAAAVHWPFLIAWTFTAAAIAWEGWRGGYHFLALSMGLWILGLGFQLDNWNLFGTDGAQPLVIAIGLGISAVAIFARDAINRLTGFASSLLIYGLIISFAGLLAVQFIESTPTSAILFLAILTLSLVIGALFYGWHVESRTLAAFAYAGFSIELLALYFKTLGTLLDTALFFFLAGLIVIALSWLALILRRRQLADMETPS